MADKAYITPKVLKWARESARISLEDAAKKVVVPVEKLQAWENGESLPTIRQAETLAHAYRRAFAILFLPDVPPHDFQLLQDFRKADTPLTTASIFIIRDIQQKQAWLSELYEDEREEPLGFVGSFTVNSNPKQVAENILETLQINPANYQTQSPLREWIDKAEQSRIFISRTSFIHSKLLLKKEELQGFAIADKFAPFVFLNTNDYPAPQLFTLVHEIAHIWIAESGVSNHVDPQAIFKEWNNPVELFCNNVAAAALMPEDVMQEVYRTAFVSNATVVSAARKLGISSFALLVRALNLQLISLNQYRSFKQAADVEFEAFKDREEARKAKQKTKDGGPNPYQLRVNKNGHLFTQIVIDAFRGGVIAPTQASALLNTQVNKISNLEAFLSR